MAKFETPQIFYPPLEYRRKLFLAYLLPLLHAIAYFAFFC